MDNKIMYVGIALALVLIIWAISNAKPGRKSRRSSERKANADQVEAPATEITIDPRARILREASLAALTDNINYLCCYSALTEAAYRHRYGPRL